MRQRRRVNKPSNGIGDLIESGLSWLFNKGLGALVSGFGDYKVENNSLMTGGLDPPTIVNTVNNGNVIIRHREYLMDISATTTFTIQALSLNPGLISTFPWLSAIASHFEQYKFRGILFEFKSLSSDSVLSSATSSALGSVIMATQYNALNPAFPDKFTMENYEFANSSKPSISFIHPVECARRDTSLTELYVRDEAAPSGSDLRLFDLGNFYIATVGMQAASGVAGELWCTYEVELIKPKISNPIGAIISTDHFQLSSSATNAAPFTANKAGTFNTLGGTLGTNFYVFPGTVVDGVFVLWWNLVGNSTATAAPTLVLTNCIAYNLLDLGTKNGLSTVGTSTQFIQMVIVQITGVNAAISGFGTGTLPASPTYGDLVVSEIPSNLTVLNEQPITIENPQPISTQVDIDSLIHRMQTMGLLPCRY